MMRATVWNRSTGRTSEVGRDWSYSEHLSTGGVWRTFKAHIEEGAIYAAHITDDYAASRMTCLIDRRRKSFGMDQSNGPNLGPFCVVIGCLEPRATALVVCRDHLRPYLGADLPSKEELYGEH